MQFDISRQMRYQPFPYRYGYVFHRWQHPFQKRNVYIEILVIEMHNDFVLNNDLKTLEIHYEAGVFGRSSFDRNIQIKIVSMPVFVCTFSKQFLVFFFTETRIEQFVGCIKMGSAGNK